MKTKKQKFNELLDEITALTAAIEAEDGKTAANSADNRDKLKSLLAEAETIRLSIEQDDKISGLKSFAEAPAAAPKAAPAGGDGSFSEPVIKSLGDQIIEDYVKHGKALGVSRHFEAKGFVTSRGLAAAPMGAKSFDSTAAGLDTSRNYVTPPGGMVLIEQQRLTVRDLIPVGETTQNTIYYPKEAIYVNGAEMVGEEGEKPEASLEVTSASAPVKKIAVLIKVTDEMWDDFPMLRDYINQRLRFMVEQKEESQLMNGNGTGNNLTGLLNTSGILTQAKGGDSNLDAIHKAITKIRVPAANVGGYEPDGIIIHPNDWQLLRLAKDLNGQYLAGGPFFGSYGNGGYVSNPSVWGLTPVITTAISQGTSLVGSFRLGAQIFQRSGIEVKTFDQNEDDVNFNRKTIRVEERLALAVYRPSAFCTVTGIS